MTYIHFHVVYLPVGARAWKTRHLSLCTVATLIYVTLVLKRSKCILLFVGLPPHRFCGKHSTRKAARYSTHTVACRRDRLDHQ